MRLELLGKTYNHLKVLARAGSTKRGHALWRCCCLVCGRDDYITQGVWIKAGRVKSCGCNQVKERHLDESQALRNKCISQVKRNAKTRKLNFELTIAQCEKLFKESCYYCQEPPSMKKQHIESIRKLGGLRATDEYVYNSIDRLDPKQGYNPNNCVAACDRCNKFKNDQALERFLSRVTRVVCVSEGKEPIVEDEIDQERLSLLSQSRKRNESYVRTELSFGIASRNNLYLAKKANAKVRKLDFTLTPKEFIELSEAHCSYCYLPPSTLYRPKVANGPYIYNGIDRVDNAIGYEKENCVTCCKYCNKAKNDFTLDEFIKHCKKIYDFQKRKK